MINTHKKINQKLCGKPISIAENVAEVVLKLTDEMAADEKGLVHGGFIFGLADYAAMLAVNHPNVVLGAATVKFLKPVVVGDELRAVAKVVEAKGKKYKVLVKVKKGDDVVFEGEFIAIVPDTHVLDR
ncbi:PaaI family thioesterase [Desulfurobacterium atlanticum]|uniref:Thioesterase superfamily n=1 Tax=Desulfurobacterium atlanticum TaxID=240169 RepID=A0A238YE60_9BACT|nr:PaaI family thioesterase [Desulfurobacterium atlanticum]SNR69427.1 Thioesterase superfamily [Desulfurobacterium atlanticum]